MLRRPLAQRYVQNRVDHLIVDEAQDMNGIQIELLKILAGDRAQVMLVGDEDRYLRLRRGTGLSHPRLRTGLPACHPIYPAHTFRFGHALSIAASQLITHNKTVTPRSVSPMKAPLTRIHCLPLTLGLADLGEHVAQQLTAGVALQDIAVLVRTYDLSTPRTGLASARDSLPRIWPTTSDANSRNQCTARCSSTGQRSLEIPRR